jgi:hypothetical protein
MYWINRIKRAQKTGKFIASDHDASTWHSDAIAEIQGIDRDAYTNKPYDTILDNLANDLDDTLEVDAVESAFFIFNQIQERIIEIGNQDPEAALHIKDLTPHLSNIID